MQPWPLHGLSTRWFSHAYRTSLVEASMDLGADGWQTLRHVTLPVVATALVAGGLLVIALTFIPVVRAQRLTRDTGVLRGAGAH